MMICLPKWWWQFFRTRRIRKHIAKNGVSPISNRWTEKIKVATIQDPLGWITRVVFTFLFFWLLVEHTNCFNHFVHNFNRDTMVYYLKETYLLTCFFYLIDDHLFVSNNTTIFNQVTGDDDFKVYNRNLKVFVTLIWTRLRWSSSFSSVGWCIEIHEFTAQTLMCVWDLWYEYI